MIALALLLAFAKPPEPLEEIFPQTQLIVDAVVVEVKAPAMKGPMGVGDQPGQMVTLEVTKVIRGSLDPLVSARGPDSKARIVVEKPINGYSLKAGVKGPWLIHVDEKNHAMTILGRYGPDTWTFEKIDEKLKELDPANLKM